jgi:uncharacterized protein (TIGR02246 family)
MKALILALVLVPVALAAQTFPPGSPNGIVRDRDAGLMAAVKKQDAEAVAMFYTADAEFTQPGDRVRTRDGIKAMWQQQFARGVESFDLKVSDASIENGVITEKGAFSMKVKGASAPATGTYVNTWRKDNSEWRLQTNAITPAAQRGGGRPKPVPCRRISGARGAAAALDAWCLDSKTRSVRTVRSAM